jgi:hypothetical protein
MKKLINICGTARCGSTMIDLILGNDPKGFSLGEVHAWFRPYRTHHFSINCSCGDSNCPWEKLKAFKEIDFYRKAFEILDVDFMVDSSKNLSWVIDNNLYARRSGIQVYNILLYKEPISYFHSFWKRGHSIKKARNRNFTKYYRRCFQSGISFIPLNYNKFTADPHNELQSLCNLLQIPYFEGKEKFWEKTHHHIFGSNGTRSQVLKGYSIISKNEVFSKEYLKLIPKIEYDNKHNHYLQNVLLNIESLEATKGNKQILNRDLKKPYWYYLIKLKQKVRQRFPERWES